MRYLSVCSGIEAASVAWHPLGWTPAAFAEVADFARAVLQHHFPNVPCHGDFTDIGADDIGQIDLLVGGTPCQSFSLAGLRGGLADDRGSLSLEFCRLADRVKPRWVVWENVPGVLSSGGGRDFGSILGALVELGYSVAYRVLDAQFARVDGYEFAVPQRRRRVFVVGYLGDDTRPGAVLFEPESVRRDHPPRRQERQAVAGTIGASLARCSADDADRGGLITFGGNNQSGPIGVATTQTAHGGAGRMDFESETFVVSAAPTLRAGGNVTGGDRPYGTDVDTCDSLIAFSCKDYGADAAVAFDMRGRDGGSSRPYVADRRAVRRAVRRLTPVECERLQGFPDNYTAIEVDRTRKVAPDEAAYLTGHGLHVWQDNRGDWRTKVAADGPRYKALGNSMAVNVMRWIGRRIDAVERFGDLMPFER